MTNSGNYTGATWQADMQLAKNAHLDAFAINMGYLDPVNQNQIANAKAAANAVGFQLFFSFDYAGNGAWPKADVIQWLNAHGGDPSYFKHNGKPLASTFEGPENATDWTEIKSSTGCFFIPDWSSLGAKAAMEKKTMDGLFSWKAWAWGPNDVDSYTDAS